jgi:hypothetical protein
VIARLVPYHAADVAEIVALARSGSPGLDAGRRVELFFLDHETGKGLSLLIADDAGLRPVIELADGGTPEDYEVRLLQVGGPRGDGVVPALLGRVVRSELTELETKPPSSPAVWTRGWLAASDRQVGFAVATDRAALDDALPTGPGAVDYDDVAYHFLRH